MQQLPAQTEFFVRFAVYRIAHHRVTDVPRMHPYLMSPARFQFKTNA